MYIYIYIYIYIHTHMHIYIYIYQQLGWQYLYNSTCPIQPPIFSAASFV